MRWLEPLPRIGGHGHRHPGAPAAHAASALGSPARGPAPPPAHARRSRGCSTGCGWAVRPLPEAALAYEETWREHHPSWQLRLWGDDDARRLVPARALAGAPQPVRARRTCVRYEVLRRFGGVYVDTDVECRRPLDPLLEGTDSLAGYLTPGRLETAVLASVPRAPGLRARRAPGAPDRRAERRTPSRPPAPGCSPSPVRATPWPGWPRRSRCTRTAGTSATAADEPFPDAYCVHHWDLSWKAEEA